MCGSGNRPLDKAGALFLVARGMEGEADACACAAPELPAKAAAVQESPAGPVMVLDVETRRSAAEVGGWARADLMGVSVAVVWDGDSFRTFSQEDLPAMFALLKRAGLVVGFNSLRFDYAVLQPFADFDLRGLPSLDMLEAIRKRLNYRVSLDNLGQATLAGGKTADGLQVLRWWKEGRINEIAAYCRRDVDITLRLYEYGKREGHLLFTNKAGQKVRVPVEW
jgi:DEAD/DEAH box helicase domain-containing protein